MISFTKMLNRRIIMGLLVWGALSIGLAGLSHATTINPMEAVAPNALASPLPAIFGYDEDRTVLANEASVSASPGGSMLSASEASSFLQWEADGSSAIMRAILHMRSCLCSGLRQLVEFSNPISTGSHAPVLPAPAAPAAMFLFMTGLVTVAGVARLQHNGSPLSSCAALRTGSAYGSPPGFLVLLSRDARLIESVTAGLGRYGFDVHCVPTVLDAGDLFLRQVPALVLVDRSLPEWEKLRHTGACRSVPMMTVALTGSDLAEDACVNDLEQGIDSTHFCDEGFRLLAAKVRALLRRSAWMTETHPVVRVGNIELDAAGCEVRVAGQAHHLPPVQFKLLRLLMESPDIVFRRRELIDLIWGQDYVVEEHTLDVHMFWLRRLLGRDPQGRQAIVTVRGVGIKFVINREKPHSTLKGGDSRPVKRVHRATCRVSKRPVKRAVMGAVPVRVAV